MPGVNIESNPVVAVPIGSGVAKEEIPVAEKIQSENPTENIQEWIKDAESMSATELKAKYPLTYNSWRNMKSRRKQGAEISKEFQNFGSFLSHVGPRPSNEMTLDRLDHENPLYAPNLVEWKNKAAQNQNRSNVILLTSESGETHPISVWAELTGQKANTLYKRYHARWADNEVITGVRKQTNLASLWAGTPWRKGTELTLEAAYQDQIRSSRISADTTRLDWYLETVSQALSKVTNEIRSYPDAPDVPVELTKRRTQLATLVEDLKRQVSERDFKKKFVDRKNSLGRAREEALYELVQSENLEEELECN